jgi:putative ABC transport system ATP-binding protein
VSFQIPAGELVAVRGPSGSGKSTLLALLAALDQPDAGEVRLADDVINHRGLRDAVRARRRSIGVLTQAGGLVEHLNVRDNVRIAGWIRGGRLGDPDAVLASVGMADRARAWPSQLSGGETARVALAISLVGDPTVLLADEPTAEVSSAEESAILALLRKVRPTHGVTVVVTHSEAVAAAADRVFELREGRLL